MSQPFNSDEDVLARMVREAGNPSVTPDPVYEDKLRSAILDRMNATETAADVNAGTGKVNATSTSLQRIKKMKRIANLAVAAVVLLALGLFALSFTGGGSSNLAFAEVAKALDNLRTATYDSTSEMKDPLNGMITTTTMKGYFRAPSQERVEMSVSVGPAKDQGKSIIILDHQVRKGLTLAPDMKLATTLDLSKTKKPAGATNPFEMVRQLVQQGGSSSADKVESLGRKEIDGQTVVGFRVQNNMVDQTFWADPSTARLVRVDMTFPNGTGHGVMNNFEYDVELDPSLFSLQPPDGYAVDTMNVEMPTEEDLINMLRLIADHNEGVFPPVLGISKEQQRAIQVMSQAATEKFMKEPETQQLLEKLKAQYGEDRAGFMKAWMKEMMPRTQKLTQKFTDGMLFYNLMNAANDSHYAGKDVKLDTPDQPIFWYRPTGADNYRVIYADLSVKEVMVEEAKQFPQPESN